MRISLSSLDDLAVLSNIVIGLQTLSQTHSAQEAQSWLYELPTLCYQQLAREHLLEETQRKVFLIQREPMVTVHQNWLPMEAAPGVLFLSPEDIHVSYSPPSPTKRSTPLFVSMR